MKTYYLLTKPGIIFGNLLTMLGGFALASKGPFSLWLFFSTLIGLGAVIASACVLNNCIDRNLDGKMERTKNRPLVTGKVTVQQAMLFAFALGGIGFLLLSLYTNCLAVSITALGFFVYVGLYSIWKAKSRYATLVGSIAGAVPPVVGYSSVSGEFDLSAALLFSVLVLWQMPHFFSIAIYRLADYTAASIPVLPVSRGVPIAKERMTLYVIAFAIIASWLSYRVSPWSLLVTAPLGLRWFVLSLQGRHTSNDVDWAKQMFFLSLWIITILSVLLIFTVVIF